jgi:WD40 repeat protein
VLVGAQCVLYSLAWSPDGKQLVASSDDGTVVLFDYGRAMAVKKWRIHASGGMVLRWAAHLWAPACLMLMCWVGEWWAPRRCRCLLLGLHATQRLVR